MKTKEIKAVLALLDGTDVTELEYEDESIRVAVRRGAPAQAVVAPTVVHSPAVAAASAPAPSASAEVVHSGHVVTS
ncbi:MAG: acetyl-CoA carboxylase biotin carboxyl carrier protein subunit, partial [Deltaproteobacteria bacterium]|nr:acetyl-CoA carboxylase biotin carboxyl carrier protein subunit [Deltaproteobacteria bacterium]